MKIFDNQLLMITHKELKDMQMKTEKQDEEIRDLRFLLFKILPMSPTNCSEMFEQYFKITKKDTWESVLKKINKYLNKST